MPPPKGTSNNPNGRAKGVPNKATAQAREAIASFVDGNAGRLQGWLDKIAEDKVVDGNTIFGKPEKAFELLMSVVEYHIPKLARTESTMEVKGNLTVLQIMDEINGRTTGLPSSESKSE